MLQSTYSTASSTSKRRMLPKVNITLAQSKLMLQVASGIIGMVPAPGASALKELLNFAENILDLVDQINANQSACEDLAKRVCYILNHITRAVKRADSLNDGALDELNYDLHDLRALLESVQQFLQRLAKRRKFWQILKSKETSELLTEYHNRLSHLIHDFNFGHHLKQGLGPYQIFLSMPRTMLRWEREALDDFEVPEVEHELLLRDTIRHKRSPLMSIRPSDSTSSSVSYDVVNAESPLKDLNDEGRNRQSDAQSYATRPPAVFIDESLKPIGESSWNTYPWRPKPSFKETGVSQGDSIDLGARAGPSSPDRSRNPELRRYHAPSLTSADRNYVYSRSEIDSPYEKNVAKLVDAKVHKNTSQPSVTNRTKKPNIGESMTSYLSKKAPSNYVLFADDTKIMAASNVVPPRRIKRPASVDSLTAPLRREDASVILGGDHNLDYRVPSGPPVNSNSGFEVARRETRSRSRAPQQHAKTARDRRYTERHEVDNIVLPDMSRPTYPFKENGLKVEIKKRVNLQSPSQPSRKDPQLETGAWSDVCKPTTYLEKEHSSTSDSQAQNTKASRHPANRVPSQPSEHYSTNANRSRAVVTNISTSTPSSSKANSRIPVARVGKTITSKPTARHEKAKEAIIGNAKGHHLRRAKRNGQLRNTSHLSDE